MTAPMNDDKLLSLLGESLADDRPSADAIEAAYAAFGWRTLDADLAQLIEDSQVEVVGFRDAAFSRIVAYETDLGTIEVSIDNDRFQAEIAPVPTKLVLRRTTDSRELPLDDAGRASASGVSGPVRFEIFWTGGSALTPWLTL
ncbi:MAG: hypothetical protein OEV40_05035 [Acidimicrobiia bacterium]|nr:hypothetical protein [Acidimicrobiia bacterium]